jgi:hypothetical protein
MRRNEGEKVKEPARGCVSSNIHYPRNEVDLELAALSMTALLEREKQRWLHLRLHQPCHERRERGSVCRKEVESSVVVVELARGIEPSNRRRVGPEACLSGSCGGGQPPRRLPTKGTYPLRNPKVEGSIVELARGIEPPTCGLQNRCSAIELRQPE